MVKEGKAVVIYPTNKCSGNVLIKTMFWFTNFEEYCFIIIRSLTSSGAYREDSHWAVESSVLCFR